MMMMMMISHTLDVKTQDWMHTGAQETDSFDVPEGKQIRKMKQKRAL